MAVLGLLVAASFCFAYFDFAAGGIERLLAERRGAERVALARDAYTYAHLPMIVGIVLFAFAMRTGLAHVHSKLHLIPALALCCGSALYLLSFVALRWRVSRRLGRGRVVAAVALALLTPIALSVSALATLVLVTAVWFALHAYELIWWREDRARSTIGARRRTQPNDARLAHRLSQSEITIASLRPAHTGLRARARTREEDSGCRS